MTDTPEPTGPMPFFAPTPPVAGGELPDLPTPVESGSPRTEPAAAPGGGQDEPGLEELLRDVRGALATLPGEPGDIAYPPAPAYLPPAPASGLPELRDALADFRAAVAELQSAQRTTHSEVTARLDAVAAELSELSTRPAPAAIAPVAADDVTLQDLHDGLAGVRTDVAGLPDLLGPAVTSAVGHGIAGPTRQLEAVTTALADTTHESGQLRAELAGMQVQLAALYEQASLLPQVQASLRDVTDRLAELESMPAEAPPPPVPDLSAIVDDRLSEHLTAFGGGLGERLDAQLVSMQSAMQGVTAAMPREDLTARLEAAEQRLAAQLETLRAPAADSGDDRLALLERRLVERVGTLDRQVAAQVQLAEQRLVRHVDEAVLALAQAVLGGPPTTSQPAPSQPAPSEAESVPGDRSPLPAPGPAAAPFVPAPLDPLDPLGVRDLPMDLAMPDVPPRAQTPEVPPRADAPTAAAELEPVPVYGTANLGLAPPVAPVEPAVDSGEDRVEPLVDSAATGVEAWAKGDDRYAELPDLSVLPDAPDLPDVADVPDLFDVPEHEPLPDGPTQPEIHDHDHDQDAEDDEDDDASPDGPGPATPHDSWDATGRDAADVLPDPPGDEPHGRRGLFRRKG